MNEYYVHYVCVCVWNGDTVHDDVVRAMTIWGRGSEYKYIEVIYVHGEVHRTLFQRASER